MQARRIDFVLTNPSHYIKLREHHRLTGALATLVMRQGSQGVHGIGGVIVRRAQRDDIRDLADIAHKRVAIAGKHYLGTYMAPALELLRAGVDLDDIAWVETSQPVDQVITSVLDGQSDVGFVRTGVLEDLEREGKLQPGELAVVHPLNHPGFDFRASTQLYPEWPFLAAADVDASISQQVSAALLNLRPDHPAARAAGLYGFTIAANYASVEQAMRELRMAPFERLPAFLWKDIWQRYHLWILGIGALSLLTTLMALGLVAHRRQLLRTQSRLEAEHHKLTATTERLNYLMASSPVMFYTLRVMRHQTEPTWVSANIEQLLGYTPSQARQLHWWTDHLHPEDAAQAVATIRGLHLSGHVRHQFRFALADGTYRWFHNDLRLLNTASGQVEALGIWRDITNTKRQEDRLQLAASVFDNSYDGVIITDALHRVVDTNPAFSRITGHPREAVLGRTLAELAGAPPSPTAPPSSALQHMLTVLSAQGHWQGEMQLQRDNGQPLVCAMSVSAVSDSSQHTGHHVVVFSDIGHIKAHQAELDRLAHYDALTGVPNRRMLVDRLAQAIERARRSGQSLAICYLDLDDFKPVNDRLGHAVGDQLLINMTRRLEGALRGQDTLARLGGDEFVLLLADLTHPDEWQPVLARVMRLVQQAVPLGEHSATVSASVGVTVYPADDVDADTLLRHADQAMYSAKQAGRNRHHVFDPTQDKEIEVQRELHSRLAQALALGELELFYQPKVHMETGQVVGAEALIRWQHPELGRLPPGEFLWQVNGSDLEIQVGEWVIHTALTQLGVWKKQGQGLPPGFSVSVNLSGHQLLKPGFSAWLATELTHHPHWQPGELELEILESAALADMASAARVMMECRALGVRFALDDFGTGYSSLAYFRTLPVDMIKIDQSFVRDMLVDTDDHGIVQSVVQLARAFQRPVIAEGVETLAHAAALIQMGCPLAQGFGIARPMPADQLADWAQQWALQRPWQNRPLTGEHSPSDRT
jgi:diguanylate cyclase (GGDEF)-like protein/PAS domain S-box-containing protein